MVGAVLSLRSPRSLVFREKSRKNRGLTKMWRKIGFFGCLLPGVHAYFTLGAGLTAASALYVQLWNLEIENFKIVRNHGFN